MSTQREMTLDEWVGILPDDHRAAKELRALRAAAVESEENRKALLAENSKIWGWYTEIAQRPAARAAQQPARGE